MSTED
ncbi:hypothetical protein GWI33_008871, partial [Rhynchophorus ferrugineus]